MGIETRQHLLKSPDEEILPNMNEIDATKIVWQNAGGVCEDFCSLNSCKKSIKNEKALFIRETKTGLIAFFHPGCFKQIRK